MKKRSNCFFLTALLILISFSLAYAHSVVLWAYVEKGKVHVEAFTQDGTKIKDGKLVVLDKSGKTLLEGKTDAGGKFTFVPPVKDEMTIVLVLDGAHKTEFQLKAEDFAEKTPEPLK